MQNLRETSCPSWFWASMRIAYLDCFSGMSGDMFLGALVDAGVPAKLLQETVAALNIGARLEISRVMRSGISAIKVDVYVNEEKELPREVFWEKREHAHEHSPVELKEHNFPPAGAPGVHEHVSHQHVSQQHSRAGTPAAHEHGLHQ